MRWLWLAAEGGNLDAMYGLSEQYKNGDYIPFDLGNMRKLLETAAAENHSESINQLGILALNPIEPGHSAAPDAAIKLFKRAAELGNTNALTNLGDMYLKGVGVEKDLSKAKELLSEAAGLGNRHASKLLETTDTIGGPVGVTERIIKEKVIFEKSVPQESSAENIFTLNSGSVFKVVVGDVQNNQGKMKVS